MRTGLLLILGFILAVPVGCAAPQTSRSTAGDFEAMAGAIAASLRAARPIATRGPGTPEAIVAIGRLTNLSSDIVTESEKRSIMNRIVNSQPLLQLARARNLRFIGEVERTATGDSVRDGGRLIPDYQLRGELRTLVRAVADGRSDTYLASFDLLRLPAGEVVWTDRFEYKRAARGEIWD